MWHEFRGEEAGTRGLAATAGRPSLLVRQTFAGRTCCFRKDLHVACPWVNPSLEPKSM